MKVLLLNNQHLGHGGAVGGPVLRGQPGPHVPRPGPPPEAVGQGEGESPNSSIPTSSRSPRASASRPGRSASKADVDAALKEMIDHTGPYVLDVLVPYQEHVLPMIPSGGTVRDIIKS